MVVKSWLLGVGILLSIALSLEAAPSTLVRKASPPPYPTAPTCSGDNAVTYASYDLRENLGTLRVEMRNQLEQQTILSERLGTLDSQMDLLYRELQEGLNISHEQIRLIQTSAEDKVAALEKMVQTLIADLKQMHEFSQKQLAREDQQRERVESLEKTIALQQRNQEHLQNASQKLAEAIGASTPITSSETEIYRVQARDSLEKIAKKHNISVRYLKEINNFPPEKDKIIVGQLLKVPAKAS